MSEIHFNPPFSPLSNFSKSDSLVNRLTKFASQLINFLPFSGVLSIHLGNELIVHKAYSPIGAAFSEDQVFNCFSSGKAFTAVAAMQLVEEGKVDLDAPITKYLSKEELDLKLEHPYLEDKPSSEDIEKLQKKADKITVRDLLTHQSGLLQSPEGPPEKFFDEIPKEMDHCYSNYGYQILALIIGKQTQNSKSSDLEERFRDHIEQRIFQTCKIKTSNSSIPTPYIFENGKWKTLPEKPIEPYPHGNGCWKLTTKDMLAFTTSLQEGQLIRKESFHALIDSNPPMGFDVDRDENKKIIGFGHPGASPYGTAFIYTFLNHEKPIHVSVLSNGPTGMDIKPMLEEILNDS